MITAANLRSCRGAEDVLALLRDLGFPVAPVALDPCEWRRAGIELPLNGPGSAMSLAARLERFDLFLRVGTSDEELASKFMTDYKSYNLVTKSCLINFDEKAKRLQLHDLGPRGSRRIDVDLNDPSRHAVDRLNLLSIAGAEARAIPRIFDRAFDRESVTRRFFERFRAAVRETEAVLAADYPEEAPDAVAAQALLLLSRLLFLCFVEVKGWLNGERRFLVDRLERCSEEGRCFYSAVLRPLFFGCLNTAAGDRDTAARALGSIPYLNGGLFEASPFERRHPDLELPNDLLRRVVEGVFSRFDFSVEERDTAGTHVDPEMLGKVFESLMAADERASSGSFYTPREIVDVLTENAMREWLTDGDVVLLSDSRRLTEAEAVRLLRRLESITVLDPACGSGAFLLAALGVLERLTLHLSTIAGTVPPRNLRQRIVERSLFGVDRKPEAVRLCELRLWLAIVSGSNAAIDEVAPLPNLDRNILQGNSLLSPTDFLGDARGDIYRDWLVAIRAQGDLVQRYRNASHDERPALYRLLRGSDQRLAAELLARAIEVDEREREQLAVPRRDLFGDPVAIDLARCRTLESRLEENRRLLGSIEEGSLDFFSFDIHFAWVMAAGGFDVVVGNPPWVRNGRIDRRAKKMIAERYVLFRSRDTAGFHQPDLSVAFLERSLALARAGGVVSMLMPAKLLNAGYAASLRRFLGERLDLIDLVDWSDEARRLFEADTFPLGVTIRRSPPRPATRITACGESFVIDQRDLCDGVEWSLVPPEVAAILRRLRQRHAILTDVLGRRPLMGVKTGDNRSFFVQVESIRRRMARTTDGLEIPLDALCRCVRGRDVDRWSLRDAVWMIWPPARGWRVPPSWAVRFAAARGIDPADLRLSFVKPEHVGIKVVWKDLSRGLRAVAVPDVVHVEGHEVPLIPNQTLYSLDAVSLDEAYAIAGLLGSSIADALLVAAAERAKDAHYRYFGRTVGRMPWPQMSGTAFEGMVRASRRAHHGERCEADIDAVAAQLYGLDARELAVLREFVKRRVGR